MTRALGVQRQRVAGTEAMSTKKPRNRLLHEAASLLDYDGASAAGQTAGVVVYPSAEDFPPWRASSRLAAGMFTFIAAADCRRIKFAPGQCVVLMVDIEKPGAPVQASGVAAREFSCRARDLSLLCHSRTYSLELELAAMQLRANGYWARDWGDPEYLAALNCILQGKSYFTDEAVSFMLRRRMAVRGCGLNRWM